MHVNQAIHVGASAQIEPGREIPEQLRRLRDAIGELGRAGDVLIARTESVRRIPVPTSTGNGDVRVAAPARAPAQTPLGLVFEEMIREVESQTRALHIAIDAVELA